MERKNSLKIRIRKTSDLRIKLISKVFSHYFVYGFLIKITELLVTNKLSHCENEAERIKVFRNNYSHLSNK